MLIWFHQKIHSSLAAVMLLMLWLTVAPVIAIGQQAANQQTADQQAAKPKGKLSGRVVGPDGKPMASAIVKLRETTRNAALNAVSDRQGRFNFKDIPSGLYIPSAIKAGYVTRTSAQSEATDPAAVRIEAGTELNDFELRLEKGGVITGKITEEGGDPVVLATVYVTEADGSSQRLQDFKLTQFFTDDRGIYRLFGLPAGRYLVKAEAKVASSNQQYNSAYYPGVEAAHQAVAVEVTVSGETKDIDFAMKRRSSENCGIAGRLTRNGESAPVQATVWVYTDETGGLRVSTPAREDGSFEFKNLASGNYTIEVLTKDPELVERTRSKVVVSPASTTNVNLNIEAGATLTGTFEMEDGSQPKQTDQLHVTAFAESLGYVISGGQVINGQFRIMRLPSGPVQFSARIETSRYYVTKILYNQEEVLDGHLSVASGEAIRGVRVILSEQGATLRGTVRQSNGNALQSAAWVAVIPMEAERREIAGLARFTRIDQRGSYFIEGIAPGKYMVLAYRNTQSLPGKLGLLDVWLADRRVVVPTLELKTKEQQNVDLRTVD